MRHIFLVFEGLSGSGKTTVARLVADRMGATFYKTPPSLFADFRKRIDREATLEARFLFYLAGCAQAAEEIEEILKTRPVVSDRYYLTTVCYHKAVGCKMEIPISSLGCFLQPDFTFLVVCQKEERLKRLHFRGLTFNDLQERKEEVEKRFLEEYRRFNLIEIDNSADDPGIAAKKILSLVGG